MAVVRLLLRPQRPGSKQAPIGCLRGAWLACEGPIIECCRAGEEGRKRRNDRLWMEGLNDRSDTQLQWREGRCLASGDESLKF